MRGQVPQRPRPETKHAKEALDKDPMYYGKLHSLTHSRHASRRLVIGVSRLHPEKSERWCVEKAVYDIERDRMAR